MLNLFRYSVLKYIGAFISVLGGVDSIVFISERKREYPGLIREICQMLEFLGLKCSKNPDLNGKINLITDQDSPIKVFMLEYDRGEILTKEAELFLNRTGG